MLNRNVKFFMIELHTSDEKNLHGQSWTLQAMFSDVLVGSHCKPSESGGGLLQIRDLDFTPPPQVLEHSENAFQLLHPPLTN